MKNIFNYLAFLIIGLLLISCSKKQETENKTTGEKTTEQKTSADGQNADVKKVEEIIKIDVTSHKDFKVFWKDFSKAVETKNIENIIQMTGIPFYDFSKTGQAEPYAKTAEDFRKIFDKIFTKSVIDLCKKEIPVKGSELSEDYKEFWGDDPFTASEKKHKAEYFFINDSENEGSLEFGKVNGIYKLIGLKYFP